jgi:hypothetical protein
MLKTKNKSQGIKDKLFEWTSKNRMKSSVFAFFLVISLVGAGKLGLSMLQGPSPAATITEEGKDIQEIPSWWYTDNFGVVSCEKDDCRNDADPDGDKLSNEQEFYFNTKALVADTNGNGQSDGEDVSMGYDPARPGKMTFEEAASDDNVVGESLVFGEDIKTLLNEMVDPNKAVLPGIDPDDIKVSQDNSPQAISTYFTSLQTILTKYIPNNPSEFITQAISTKNEDSKLSLKRSSEKVLDELEKLTVPSEVLTFHKYTMMSMILLPIVINPPADESALQDDQNIEATEWYEATRAYAALIQKLELETTRLQN